MKIFWAILFVFSTFFTDLPLLNFFGEFGRSLVNLLFPMWFLITFLNIKKEPVSKFLLWCVVLISLAGFQMFLGDLYYLIDTTGHPVIRGEHIIIKNFKMIMYLLSNIFFTSSIISLFSSKKNLKKLLKVSFFAFLALPFITIIEFIDPFAFSYIHARELSGIPRLFTAEPSWTNYLINSLFVASALYFVFNKRKSYIFYTIVLTQTFLLLTSNSKLFLFFGSINLLLIVMFQLSAKRLERLLLLIVIFVFIIFFLIPKFFQKISVDVEKFTSFATRFGTNLAAFIYLLKYPIASGAVYLHYFPDCLEDIAPIIKKFNLNISEISSYIYSSEESAMTVKGSWGAFMIFYGIIPLILMLKLLFKLLYNLKGTIQSYSYFIYSLFLLNLLVIPIFDGIITRPHFWYILALAYIIKNLKNPRNPHNLNYY